jgi:rubrerythrin
MAKSTDLWLVALIRAIRHLQRHGVHHMAHSELEDELTTAGEWTCPYCGQTISVKEV